MSATTTRSTRLRWLRRARLRVLLVTGIRRTAFLLGVYSVVAAILIIVSCLINDLRIDQDMGTAVATVTEVTPRRTAVQFDTPYGRNLRPENGVFYPTGLREGEQVRVEYRRANPELVRVADRRWTVAIWPALSVPVFTIPLCAVVYWFTSRRGRPRL